MTSSTEALRAQWSHCESGREINSFAESYVPSLLDTTPDQAAFSENRKSIAMLKAEHDQYREFQNKIFTHIKTGEEYQLLFTAFDEATNDIVGVYSLCAMTWLKFVRPVSEFLEKFEQGHNIK